MRILLIGYGKMGKMVEALAPEYGCEVADIVDIDRAGELVTADRGRWKDVDVAVDFSAPDAVPANLPALAARGLNLVVGTTGWGSQERRLREAVASAGVGVVAAANFSTGVVLFEAIVADAARLFAARAEFGAYLHEAHHSAKKDAPSGTALALTAAMERAGFKRPIDVSSTRVGCVPGTHTIGFDGPVESVTLTHTARDRSTFARGALTAARWVAGKRGWFSMRDVLGLA